MNKKKISFFLIIFLLFNFIGVKGVPIFPQTIITGYDVDSTRDEQQRKVFKNPRGKGYYYSVIETGDHDWSIYKSSDGSTWNDTGYDIHSASGITDSPSLWIWEDVNNSRLIIWFIYAVVDPFDKNIRLYINSRCFEIKDNETDPSFPLFNKVVSTRTDDGVYNPVVCLGDNGYLWFVWVDEFTNKGKQRGQLRGVCTTTKYPTSLPTLSPIVNIYGHSGSTDHSDGLRVEGNILLLRPSISPLTATGNVAITFCYYDFDNSPNQFLKGWTGSYSGSGSPSIGNTVSFTQPTEYIHSQVTETGSNSDVFVLSENYGDVICSKWDVSGDSVSSFGKIYDGTPTFVIISLSLSIDKYSDPDKLYAFYNPTNLSDYSRFFYKTIYVDASPPNWVNETRIDDDSESIDYFSSTYEDWGSFYGEVQLIYTRQTGKDIRFWKNTVSYIENVICVSSNPNPDDLEWFFLNSTMRVSPNTSYFDFVRIDLDPTGLNLSSSYNNVTDVFKEENDPNNYFELDVSFSTVTDLNDSYVRVDFYVRFFVNVTKEGSYDVKVFSRHTESLTDTDIFSGVFSLNIRTPEKPIKLFGAGFNSTTPYVSLGWYHNQLIYDFFEVQNSTNKADWDYLNQTILRVYFDFEVENGTERYYRIRSCRNTGVGWKNSSWSDINFEKVFFIKDVFGDVEPAYVGLPISYWFFFTLWGSVFFVSVFINQEEILMFSGLLGMIFGVFFLVENSIIGLLFILFNLYLFYRSMI